MLAAIPKLRAFAISLSGRTALADDLVQETLVRAWGKIDSFERGTNMVGWLLTILRNEFYSEYRKLRREVPDPDGLHAMKLASRPTQDGHMEFRDFQAAFRTLRPHFREAIILVVASRLSYEEAAQICGCAVGTMKSRVSRARAILSELLNEPIVTSDNDKPRASAAPRRLPSPKEAAAQP
jgi:RNA polymerase sigma-70 factor (ECF subfamily)